MSSHFHNSRAAETHVLCVGAAVLDTIFKLDTLPSGQGKFLPTQMMQVAEGMASSAAYAVAQMGGRVTLWSAIGADAAGQQIRNDLHDAGIDVDSIITVEGARSALSTILVDDEGERMIIPFYDPSLHHDTSRFSAYDMSQFSAVLVDVRWPALAYETLMRAKALGIPAILDGDVAPIETLHHLGSAASHIIFSEPAAAALSGQTDGSAILLALREIFPSSFLSVTFGDKGSYWLEAGSETVEYHTTLHVEAIDTLAAGDVFHGTFAQGLAEGLPMLDIIRLASAAAALKCTRFGGRLGTPNRAEAEHAVQAWIGASS